MAKLNKRFVDTVEIREKDYIVWDDDLPGFGQRWCRFLRQGHKVDRPMRRTIQHEDTQTV